MKENGINKLTELLDEYKKEKNIFNTDMDGQLEIGCYIYVNYPCVERLCSKQFGFIKWLVDNDKIDRDEINNNHLDIEIFYKQTYGPNYGEGGYGEIDYWYKCIGLYESLLCNLAISENPISDLISYLK